jgi:3,4-dihydroxy 2-butanone 4-phosphate synthase / GTP cyclohydrolase II
MKSVRVQLDTVEQAITQIKLGRPVIVVDDPGRENEGDFIMAAQDATPEWMAFFMRYSTGIICAPMPGNICDHLQLPPMHKVNEDRKCTAFTVSVDAREDITTGVSAADRATTLRVLADPTCLPSAITRPGHIFPLRARTLGVLKRPGHTEASVDLVRLAGKYPVAAIVETVKSDGTMMRVPDLIPFAKKHGLAIISITDLVAYRRQKEVHVEELSNADLPTKHGNFRISVWRDSVTGDEHVALTMGSITSADPVLVRAHSECITGDVFGSKRCDCGEQLQVAMGLIAKEGRGVLIHLAGHEGRGIGIANKIRAYALQDKGADTVDANLELGFSADAREYHVVGHILRAMGVDKIRLLTNNPAKQVSIGEYVQIVRREPLETPPNEHNIDYLRVKRQRLNHTLNILDEL